jgi:hypothetical protein
LTLFRLALLIAASIEDAFVEIHPPSANTTIERSSADRTRSGASVEANKNKPRNMSQRMSSRWSALLNLSIAPGGMHEPGGLVAC